MGIDRHTKVWDGVFRTFSEAAAEDNVFEGTVWLDKIAARAHSLVEASKCQNSTSFFALTCDYALPFVAAIASRRESVLRIVDFGGGMATSYLSMIAMIPKEHPLHFVVVENEAICRTGRNLFLEDSRIAFVDSFPVNQTFDIVHAGSSMQYVDDWRGTLNQFAQTQAKYLLFVDLPAGDIETFVTTQLFHGRRIPVRFWNFQEFTSAVEDYGYDLVFKAGYRGYYLDGEAELPTAHFDSKHRLKAFCQLIYRRKDDVEASAGGI